MIWVTLSIAGIACLPLLHVQWQPSHTLPALTVNYAWQNVSGRVVEQEVTSVLEGGLNRIRGIRKIASVSRNNGGYITIEFDKATDMDAARFEASSVIRQLYPKLPEGVSYPALSLNRADNEQEKALLVYSLQAPANPAGIQQYAEERMKPALAQVEGVNRMAVYGASPYEWMIEYDAAQLQAAGLTPYAVQQAVSRYYGAESLGTVRDTDAGGREAWMQLSVGNSATRRARLEEIPLAQVDGRQLLLGDIARIRHVEQEPASYYRINGMNTINMVVYASAQANHIVTAKRVADRIRELETALPEGYSLRNAYNSTEHIADELNKIYIRTVATICILLCFILLMTRKFRFLLIILFGVAVNICIALGMYFLLGIELHLYSLAGVTISLGLIIDNTIVMTEHIRSRGDRRVFLAILAATATSVIALSAVFLLDERMKLNLADFVIVVIINLMVSLASAWFLTPALYRRLAGENGKREAPAGAAAGGGLRKSGAGRQRKLAVLSRVYAATLAGVRRYRRTAWALLALGFGLPVFLLPEKAEGESRWAEFYNRTLGSTWYLEKAKPVTDRILGGALRLFARFVYEGAQWNAGRERTTLSVVANMPPGSTIAQMNQVMERLEAYLAGFDAIELFTVSIDNPQNARMEITFDRAHEFGYFPHYLKNRLIEWSINSGAAEWGVYGFGDGFSNRMSETGGSYRIRLYGYHYEELYSHAEQIARRLKENPRIKEVNLMSRFSWYKNINREFVLIPDVEQLAASGISMPEYFVMASNASGNERVAAGTLIDGAYRQVKYRAKQLPATDKWELYNSLLQSGDARVKLSSLGKMVKEPEQREICKENQQYTMVLSYDYVGSGRFGRRLHERVIREAGETLPLGFKAEDMDGDNWWQKERKQYWLVLLIIAVMYVLCAILFESLWQPLAVISMVPFGFIGLFLTFYLFHLNFDQGGFAALVLLCALTVNAAIYIINDFNNLKKTSPCAPRRIYMQALHGKIMPVLLTILSTILGLIPFVAGETREPFWFALAAGTMGGLLFSLIGIVFYLPLFFFGKSSPRRRSRR
ncbi:MAG: efflux RND transporter permease subunit [Bacteroidales bacterium]|nr:efflux RND transporter permease subunit [Bacteroidales bacterium]